MSAQLRRIRFLAVLGLGLGTLPACQSTGTGPLGRDRTAMRPNPAVVPYSAYRPAYSPGPPKRTLLLGGYAGYNYSDRVVPRGYVPTSQGAEFWGSPPTHREKAGQGRGH